MYKKSFVRVAKTHVERETQGSSPHPSEGSYLPVSGRNMNYNTGERNDRVGERTLPLAIFYIYKRKDCHSQFF